MHLSFREFFPEETFIDAKFGDMTLKSLQRGVKSNTDTLLNWIEKGCSDALVKKYLETVTMGIFTDIEHPEQVLESYTISFGYPASKEHETIRMMRSTVASLQVKTMDGESKTVAASLNVTFKQQIVRILRSLCVMIQTLGPLPEKKYVSLQLTYYDELTPHDYEPPGFSSTVFDLAYAFRESTLKHDFGMVRSKYHQVRLALETAVSGEEEEEEVKAEAVTVGKVPIQTDETIPAAVVANDTQDTIGKNNIVYHVG